MYNEIMKRARDVLKGLVVVVSAVIITSLGIDATQTFEGSQSALSILADDALRAECPEGAVLFNEGTGGWCVDKYEASVGTGCRIQQPSSAQDTALNLIDPECVPESVQGALPWTHTTYHQAVQLCGKADKELISAELWYRASAGTPDSTVCAVNGNSINKTGDNPGCSGVSEVYDMVGNAWEWIAATSEGGEYKGRGLPADGYVQAADAAGIAVETGEEPNMLYGKDYFWSPVNGLNMMLRGGFYGSKSDAGVFATQANMDPNFSGEAVGFRCARWLQ